MAVYKNTQKALSINCKRRCNDANSKTNIQKQISNWRVGTKGEGYGWSAHQKIKDQIKTINKISSDKAQNMEQQVK